MFLVRLLLVLIPGMALSCFVGIRIGYRCLEWYASHDRWPLDWRFDVIGQTAGILMYLAGVALAWLLAVVLYGR